MQGDGDAHGHAEVRREAALMR
ncbi:MAG: hypothetical protein JWQ52_2286, partial [Phenylobacterium sp.]|nr:hypothetical protein [Phenylobacterium sp.]